MVNIYKIDYKEIKKNILSLNKSDYLVIKSNAYGFGFKKILQLSYECGMRKFCVLHLEDAIYISKKYQDTIVLLLGPFDINLIKQYIENNIVITVTRESDLEIIKGKSVLYQVELNSGMNRFGLEEFDYLKYLVDDRCLGVYSHNATNQILHINNQMQSFFEKVKFITGKDIHFASSSIKDFHIPFTTSRRIGCATYENSLSISAKVISVNYCKKGSYVGYDYSYEFNEDSYIGVIDIGYADGLERNCEGFMVYIEGDFYPLIGKACMNHSFVLLNDDKLLDKEVIIIGNDNKIENYLKYFKKIPHEVYLSYLKRY